MGNMLGDGKVFLAGQQKQFMSGPVTYRRGEQSVEIQARLGNKDHEEATIHGSIITHQSIDFVFQSVDLDFGSGPVEPQRGDQILMLKNANTNLVYEVGPPQLGTDCFKYEDNRLMIRAHTKLVREEAA